VSERRFDPCPRSQLCCMSKLWKEKVLEARPISGIFSCSMCDKTFVSPRALNGHNKVHSPKYEDGKRKVGVALALNGKQSYEANPKKCEHCEELISYEQHCCNFYAKFCSNSCAASFNNVVRGARSEKTKELISKALMKNKESWRKTLSAQELGKRTKRSFNFFLRSVAGPYSKLFQVKCSHCHVEFVSSRKRKYCREHSGLYLDAGRNVFEFTFNPFKHPDLFSIEDLIRLKEKGFWSPSNKEGLTRDHRVSVNEAIKNNYDPYYIKHPLNCELMGWQENNQKKTRSSIMYKELKSLVDAHERKM
jgi:hypothetical protein